MAAWKNVSTNSEAVANSSLSSVDDDTDTCFATMTESNPWWMVDLAREYTLVGVELTTTDGQSGGVWLFSAVVTTLYIIAVLLTQK